MKKYFKNLATTVGISAAIVIITPIAVVGGAIYTIGLALAGEEVKIKVGNDTKRKGCCKDKETS